MVMHSKLHFLFTEERNVPGVRPAHMVVTSVLGAGCSQPYIKTLHTKHKQGQVKSKYSFVVTKRYSPCFSSDLCFKDFFQF